MNLSTKESRKQLISYFKKICDRLQNYKIDPSTGHVEMNQDKLDLEKVMFEDDLEGCIKFVDPAELLPKKVDVAVQANL